MTPRERVIDNSSAMPVSSQDVIEEVKLRIAQLAGGGGYVLAPSNHLQSTSLRKM